MIIEIIIPCKHNNTIKQPKTFDITKDNKMHFDANAIYIFDDSKNKFIDWYYEINDANFRVTDYEMLYGKENQYPDGKGNIYYRKKFIHNSRKELFDSYCDNRTRKKGKSQFKNISDVNRKNVLSFFKKNSNFNTLKDLFSILNGSNITGAKSSPKSTPLKCIDNEFYFINFLNVFESEIIKKKYQARNKAYGIDKKMKLSDFLEHINNNSKDFAKIFVDELKKYNEFLYNENIDDQVIINPNKKIDKYPINQSDFNLPQSQEDYIHMVVNKHFDEDFKKMTDKLRSFYISNINAAKQQKQIAPCNLTIIPIVLEKCHIIPFANLVKSVNNQNTSIEKVYNLKQSIDPFNCIIVSGDIHTAWDHKKIKLNHDYQFVIEGNSNKHIAAIDRNTLHPKQEKYLKQILQNY